MHLVEAPVMDVLPMVKVISAFCATETPVKVIDPVRPLHVTVPEAAPDPTVTGRDTPLPVPAATRLPAEAVTLPVVATTPVPPVTVVEAETAPAEATILPEVAVMPVPAVMVVVAAKLVVVVNEPGVMIADGKETVATPAVVDTVTWLAVPLMARIAPALVANSIQLPPPA